MAMDKKNLNSKSSHSKKYLIDIHHGLGDLIHMMPAISAIKKHNPQNWVSVLVGKPYIKDFLETQNIADEIIVLDKKRILGVLSGKKKILYDYGVIAPCIFNKKISKYLLRLMGATNIVSEKPSEKETEIHRVDRNNELIKSMGIEVKNPFPTINLTSESKEYGQFIKSKIKSNLPTIGVCIGGNYEKYIHDGIVEVIDVKRWPWNYWIQLLIMLQDKFNILLIGGVVEAEEFWESCGQVQLNNVIDLLGKTTVLQSAGAINCCNVLVGNDTGMIHVGAAIGKESFTIFNSTNPQKVGAYAPNAHYIEEYLPCKYCYLSEATYKCKDRKCLTQIKPQRVYDEILFYFNKNKLG